MGKDAIDRDIMMEFETDMFRAKRAIVVAIILSVILIGIVVAAYLLQDIVYSEEHEQPLEAETEFADSFAIATYNTPVVIEVERTNPVDICLVEQDYYDQAESTADAFRLAIAVERGSRTFKFEGDLDTGEYVILMSASQFDDIVKVKLTRYVIKPCMLWILIVDAFLVLLFFLRIGLKIRRLRIIKMERDDYMARATARPPPSQLGWGGKPPPGEVPIYEAAYRPPHTPQYSQTDMDYFGSVDDSGGREDVGRLEFTPPTPSRRDRAPPPKGEPAMRHRPPRPAFRKRDKYGFKEPSKPKKEKKEPPKEKKERPKREKYHSKRVQERMAKAQAKKRSDKKDKKKKKEKDKEGGYLDFDDFD